MKLLSFGLVVCGVIGLTGACGVPETTHEEVGRLPGVETLPFGDVIPGPTPDTYAYSRDVVTRNLYRIPLE